MRSWIERFSGLVVLVLVVVVPFLTASEKSTSPQQNAGRQSAQTARILSVYRDLPLSFEENRGQAQSDVKFVAHGTAQTLLLNSEGAVLNLRRQRTPRHPWESPEGVSIRMTLAGSNVTPQVRGEELLPGVANYKIGSLSAYGIPTYAKVRFADVYPGVDLVYHGTNRQLEYDFVVNAGAPTENIQLLFEGIQGLETDADGNLLLHAADGDLLQHRPVAYQESASGRREISAKFAILAKNKVGFEIGDYDRTRPIVIDPVLAYSTYYGGTGDDFINGLAVDPQGNTYVAGTSNSGGSLNYIFMSKFGPTGTTLLYSTGVTDGQCNSEGTGIAVDGNGIAYVSGMYGTVDQWGFCNNKYAYTGKLDGSGAFLYSLYFGGGDDRANAVAVDSAGNAYFTGQTNGNWPTTAGAFQVNGGFPGDAFVLKLDPSGNIVYSSYLGGGLFDEGLGIAVDSQKNAVIVGTVDSSDFPVTASGFQQSHSASRNCFVSEFNAAGSALRYSTYLGGETGDECTAVAVDGSGKTYVTGDTESAHFPVTANAYDKTCGTDGNCNEIFACNPDCHSTYFEDSFVAKIDPALSGAASLIYSTFIGGENRELGQGIVVDAAGNAYVAGRTASTFYPTLNPIQAAEGGDYDVFLAEVNPSGSNLLFSTYLGGNGYDEARAMAIDAGGNLYIAGETTSTAGFPTKNPSQGTNAGGTDGFLLKIATGNAAPALASVTLNPTVLNGPGTSTGTVTLSAAAPAGGITVTLASNNTNAATVPANVVVAQGNTTATFTVTGKTVATAATVTISGTYNGVTKSATLTVNPPAVTVTVLSLNPTSLIGGASSTGTVTLSGPAPAGGATVTLTSNNGAATVPASVAVASGNSSATFTVTTSVVANVTTATITASYNGTSAQAGLTVNPVAAALSAISVNPASVDGGASSTGTVTLTSAAPAGGIAVALSSNNGAATVPASVTVAQGSATASFTITTKTVASDTNVTISGAYNGVTKTATLTVKTGASVSVTGLALLPKSVVSGKQSMGTITLSGPAPANMNVTLSSSNPAFASVPASVPVTAGAITAQFNVSTFGVAANTVVAISASAGGATKSASLTVKPAALASLTLKPKSVKGGNSSTGTVKLNGLAPASGATVTLSSSNGAIASVPSSVLVNGNTTAATFAIGTHSVAASTPVTISVTYGGKTKSVVLTVNP